MVRNYRSLLEYYDRYCEIYDETLLECKSQTQMIHEFVKLWNNIDSGAKLLDIGCGTGAASLHFVQDKVDIYGIDGSAGMLKIFADKKFAIDWKLVNLVVDKLPYDSDFFDLVISNNAFCFLPSLDYVFKETARVTKANGLFCFSVENISQSRPSRFERGNKDIYWHGPDYLQKIMGQSGFVLVSMQNYQDYVSCVDKFARIATIVLCRKNQ